MRIVLRIFTKMLYVIFLLVLMLLATVMPDETMIIFVQLGAMMSTLGYFAHREKLNLAVPTPEKNAV